MKEIEAELARGEAKVCVSHLYLEARVLCFGWIRLMKFWCIRWSTARGGVSILGYTCGPLLCAVPNSSRSHFT